MEFRYEKSGSAYLPMFRQLEFSDEWKYFTKKSLENVSGSKDSILTRLCKQLANMNEMTCRKQRDPWQSDIQEKYTINYEGNEVVYFMEEFMVCAFLGAAKSFYSRQVTDFDI